LLSNGGSSQQSLALHVADRDAVSKKVQAQASQNYRRFLTSNTVSVFALLQIPTAGSHGTGAYGYDGKDE
jgi:hypothetical protein